MRRGRQACRFWFCYARVWRFQRDLEFPDDGTVYAVLENLDELQD